MSNFYNPVVNGLLPKDWRLVSISEIADVRAGGTPSTKNSMYWGGDIHWMNSGDINLRRIKKVDGRITQLGLENSSTKLMPANSVLMALAGQGKTRGKVAINEFSLCTNQSLATIYNFKNADFEFIFQNLESRYSEIRKMSTGDGGRGGLNLRIINSIKIGLPPLPEQKKIAEILSTVDAKIEVIDQQISETQELKKGLMQRLLSKGIGHTEFKDSPLGEIPASWEVVKLAEIAKCFVGIASSATHAYTEKGILLIRNQNIKEGRLDISDALYVTEEYELQHKSKRLKEGDILTVRTGYPGVSAVVPAKLAGKQSFTTLITRLKTKTLNSYFLCYYINSDIGKSFFNNNKIGGGQKNVGSKTLETMSIPIPNMEEQIDIINVLNTADNKLKILSEKKTNYRELKKGLMQQLLTGKVRVKVSTGA